MFDPLSFGAQAETEQRLGPSSSWRKAAGAAVVRPMLAWMIST
jgi:hypothetical protein